MGGVALRAPGVERGRGMLLPGVLPAGAGEGAGWKRPACACACVCCVWRGRDVDEERALFLPPEAQLIVLPGAAQAVSALDSERGRRASQRSAGQAREAAKESRAGEKSNLCLELGFFFANAKGNMQHIFAFFCTSFLGAVLGANFPNNIQIGECGAGGDGPDEWVGLEKGWWGKSDPIVGLPRHNVRVCV